MIIYVIIILIFIIWYSNTYENFEIVNRYRDNGKLGHKYCIDGKLRYEDILGNPIKKTNDIGFDGGNSYINTDNQIELNDFKGKKCSDNSDCDIDLICNKQKVCVKDLDKNIQDDVVIYNGEIYYTDYRNDFIEYDTNCPANKKFRVNNKCYNYDDASNYKCTTDCKKCSIKNNDGNTLMVNCNELRYIGNKYDVNKNSNLLSISKGSYPRFICDGYLTDYIEGINNKTELKNYLKRYGSLNLRDIELDEPLMNEPHKYIENYSKDFIMSYNDYDNIGNINIECNGDYDSNEKHKCPIYLPKCNGYNSPNKLGICTEWNTSKCKTDKDCPYNYPLCMNGICNHNTVKKRFNNISDNDDINIFNSRFNNRID